eukprot:2414415-Pyramimonas_sp.AAC.1
MVDRLRREAKWGRPMWAARGAIRGLPRGGGLRARPPPHGELGRSHGYRRCGLRPPALATT